MFFLVDLAGDLRLAGVFEDDLRFAAGLEVVSDCAIALATVSDSTVG